MCAVIAHDAAPVCAVRARLPVFVGTVVAVSLDDAHRDGAAARGGSLAGCSFPFAASPQRHHLEGPGQRRLRTEPCDPTAVCVCVCVCVQTMRVCDGACCVCTVMAL